MRHLYYLLAASFFLLLLCLLAPDEAFELSGRGVSFDEECDYLGGC